MSTATQALYGYHRLQDIVLSGTPDYIRKTALQNFNSIRPMVGLNVVVGGKSFATVIGGEYKLVVTPVV